jgi:hypothetical protein
MTYFDRLLPLLESSDASLDQVPLKDVNYALDEARKRRGNLLKSKKRDAEQIKTLTTHTQKLLSMRVKCHSERGMKNLQDQLLSAREKVNNASRLDPFDFEYLNLLEAEFSRVREATKKK